MSGDLVFGMATVVHFATGDSVGATYALTPADWLIPSHVIGRGGMVRNPLFNGQLQGRLYDGRVARAARELVLGTSLDPHHVLDPTQFAGLGPPVCLPDGQVIAGNHRALVVLHAIKTFDDAFGPYQSELGVMCSRLGFDAAAAARIASETLVLVRVVEEVTAEGKNRSVDEWARLNARSDEPLSKAFDPLTSSMRAAKHLSRTSKAMEFLRQHAGARGIAAFLGSDRGYEFALRLMREGVIPLFRSLELRQRHRSRLRASIRHELLEMLYVRAIGDSHLSEQLTESPQLERRIAPALPDLAVGAEGWVDWFRSQLRKALREQLHGNSPSVIDSDSDQLNLSFNPSPAPSEEVRAIDEFLRSKRGTEFADHVRKFRDAILRDDRGNEDPSYYADVCIDIFGKPSALPNAQFARGLLSRLALLSKTPKERQVAVGNGLLSPAQLDELEHSLDEPVAIEGTRGRRPISPRGILLALALLRRFRVAERRYHRYWRELPPAWNCGSWSTFIKRRAAWSVGSPSVWGQLVARLDTFERQRAS